MSDEKLAAVCGLYCGPCEYLGEQCGGCGYIEGKPFWTSEMRIETCPLYDCCINKKQLEHCGLCDELPCETFLSLSDPALSPEEVEKSIRVRRDELLKRKEIGTERWLESLQQQR